MKEKDKNKMLTLTERQMLDLVAVGLGFKQPCEELFSANVDWQELHRQAARQTVVGTVFDGIAKLPATMRPPKTVLLQWYAEVMRIEQSNHRLNEAVKTVVGRYRAAGLTPVLLKGQGVAQYYPNPLHRQSGDIDIFFYDQYDKANAEAARWEGVEFHHDTSYHQGFMWHGVEVENHSKYVGFYHPRNVRRWQEWQKIQPLTDGERLRMGGFEVDVPAPQMNAVYIFLHLLHHFLQMGVGLRQVCDWLCLLNSRADAVSEEKMAMAMKLLPIRRSMTALGFIAVHYLSFPEEKLPFHINDRRTNHDAKRMLRDILDTGNFGKDTDLSQSFHKGNGLKNMKAYMLTLYRHIHLFRFCPSELMAYPIDWIGRQLKKESSKHIEPSRT